MKLTRLLLPLFAFALLGACGGAKDNTEPPAPLTTIESAIPLIIDWSINTRAAENSAAYRLRPLLAGENIYSIDTRGTVSFIDPTNGRKVWDFSTGLGSG